MVSHGFCENLIKKTRAKIAKEHIKEFLNKMSELGFNNDEIIEVLTDKAGRNE